MAFSLFRKTESKLSPAEAARKKLGLNGQQGEELVPHLVEFYKQGFYTDVYQVSLGLTVNYDNFYLLQGKAMRLADKWKTRGTSHEEATVRALLEMSAWTAEELAECCQKHKK